VSKRFNSLNGSDFLRMIVAAADGLKERAKQVNALNVFPVPDGDTGTNMSMTLSAGADELLKKPSGHLGKAAETLARGLLMGARGNSGVILSQLFRGFAKSVHDAAEVDAAGFAAALQSGVDTAYKAVAKPVEGTILTVAREAARQAVLYAKRTQDIAEVMREALAKGCEALNRTPDMLPVLKQVGVVDAGGQGLIYIYESFLSALLEMPAAEPLSSVHPAFGQSSAAGNANSPVAATDLAARAHAAGPVQAQLAAEQIEHGYCTEFIIVLPDRPEGRRTFHETTFREEMGRFGDSLLVVADEQLVKVHIHSEQPGDVMNYAMKYGELTRIKIENMREQHAQIVRGGEDSHAVSPTEANVPGALESGSDAGHSPSTPEQAQPARFGIVAVASGDGLADIFKSIGVDVVLHGGQTMNPSTENIVEAVRNVSAETVYVLPNNSNIILAARQAQELVEDRRVVVIPSKTIPQGIAAALAFQEHADAESNAQAMQSALDSVRSGQVTYAVRDTQMDGVTIRKGDFIGMLDNRIAVSDRSLAETCRKLLAEMIEDDENVLSIYSGEGVSERDTEELVRYLRERYPNLEVEVHFGGQPVYAYIFSVE